MVKVPDYVPYPTVRAEDTPTRPIRLDVSPDMFGANVGKAISGIGQVFSKISDEFSQIQNMQDDITVSKFAIQNDIQQNQLTEGFEQLPQDKVAENLPKHIEDLTKTQEAPMQGMSLNQQRLYMNQTRWKTEQMIDRSTRFAVQTQKSYATQLAKSQVLSLEDKIAANPTDPNVVEQGLRDITEAYTKIYGSEATAPALVQEKLKIDLGKTIYKITTEVAAKRGDPQLAYKILEAHRNDITTQYYDAAYDRIRRADIDTHSDQTGRVISNEALGGPKTAVPYTPAPTRNYSPVPSTKPNLDQPATGKRSEASPPGTLAAFKEGIFGKSDTEGTGSLLSYADSLYTKASLSTPDPKGALVDSRKASASVQTEKLDPEFKLRLNAAISAAEKATGEKASIVDAYRSPERQAQYYADYKAGRGGLAAPPGRSRHQFGQAVDLKRGAVLQQLWAWHRNGQLLENFGLEFLSNRAGRIDPVHLQIARGVTPQISLLAQGR